MTQWLDERPELAEVNRELEKIAADRSRWQERVKAAYAEHEQATTEWQEAVKAAVRDGLNHPPPPEAPGILLDIALRENMFDNEKRPFEQRKERIVAGLLDECQAWCEAEQERLFDEARVKIKDLDAVAREVRAVIGTLRTVATVALGGPPRGHELRIFESDGQERIGFKEYNWPVRFDTAQLVEHVTTGTSTLPRVRRSPQVIVR